MSNELFREAYAQSRKTVPPLGEEHERDLKRGLVFQDGKLGECMFCRTGDQVWLHKRHPDGMWTTVRPMNADEVGLMLTIGRAGCALLEPRPSLFTTASTPPALQSGGSNAKL